MSADHRQITGRILILLENCEKSLSCSKTVMRALRTEVKALMVTLGDRKIVAVEGKTEKRCTGQSMYQSKSAHGHN